MLTTFYSYGSVAPNRQGEIIKNLSAHAEIDSPGRDQALVIKMMQMMRDHELRPG